MVAVGTDNHWKACAGNLLPKLPVGILEALPVLKPADSPAVAVSIKFQQIIMSRAALQQTVTGNFTVFVPGIRIHKNQVRVGDGAEKSRPHPLTTVVWRRMTC